MITMILVAIETQLFIFILLVISLVNFFSKNHPKLCISQRKSDLKKNYGNESKIATQLKETDNTSRPIIMSYLEVGLLKETQFQ